MSLPLCLASNLTVCSGLCSAEISASLYGEAFDDACARWERDLSPDGVARHVERLKEDGLYDATKPDASQVLERAIPASQFANKWTPKRIHYIEFKRTVTKNLGILLRHSLGKLPRGQLKVHNRSSLDVTAKQAYNAVKRWTKNLTECKIYSNLDELLDGVRKRRRRRGDGPNPLTKAVEEERQQGVLFQCNWLSLLARAI